MECGINAGSQGSPKEPAAASEWPAGVHGTTAKKRKAAKITKCTMP